MKKYFVLAIFLALFTACGSWRPSSINQRDDYSLKRDSLKTEYSNLSYNNNLRSSDFNFKNLEKIHEVANKRLPLDSDGFLPVLLANLTHQAVDVNIYVNLSGTVSEEMETDQFNINEKLRVHSTILNPQGFEYIKLPAGNYIASFKYRDRMGINKIRLQPFQVDGIEKSIGGLRANGRCYIKQSGVERLKF